MIKIAVSCSSSQYHTAHSDTANMLMFSYGYYIYNLSLVH